MATITRKEFEEIYENVVANMTTQCLEVADKQQLSNPVETSLTSSLIMYILCAAIEDTLYNRLFSTYDKTIVQPQALMVAVHISIDTFIAESDLCPKQLAMPLKMLLTIELLRALTNGGFIND